MGKALVDSNVSNWGGGFISQLLTVLSSESGGKGSGDQFFYKQSETTLMSLQGGLLEPPTLAEDGRVLPEESSCDATRRILQTVIVGSIVIGAVGFLPVVIVGNLQEADGDFALKLVMGITYYVANMGVYYLEGGQGSRFLAYYLPLNKCHHLGRAKERLSQDRFDNRDFCVYVGVRQFLTLGTTFGLGNVVGYLGNQWSVTSDTSYGPPLLVVCNMIAVSSLAQLVPQLRAEGDIGFANANGNVFIYAACTAIGKVFNPAPFCSIICDAMISMKANTKSYDDVQTTWPSMRVLKKRLADKGLAPNCNKWVVGQDLGEKSYVPAHVLCLINQCLLEGWEKGQLSAQDAEVALRFLRKSGMSN